MPRLKMSDLSVHLEYMSKSKARKKKVIMSVRIMRHTLLSEKSLKLPSGGIQ
jgi:hypothetical protein